ncbi:SURF1 family cytochrome oxidase biogenesis protein [Leucobacter salsicius]|uniref:SURF1 family cytochrome oxidase biogenesis protein n=1 Tax=Leucobacter salsicius TaxID=664638 RepID=UPI000368055C|nr:SURF1 family protein [Leucobacter salsicius]
MTDTQTAAEPAAGADSATVPPPGWSFLRSRRWLGYFAMLLVFSVVCVWLGNWQFDRRAEARAEIDRIDSNYEAPATELASALSDPAAFDLDAHKWLPVVVEGEYVGEPVFARNRPGPDGVGSDLIQAFQADDGRVFYVNRGWIPVNGNEAEAGDFDPDLVPAAPEGPVTVEARLRASEPVISGRTAGERSVASINVPVVAEVTGIDAETYTGAYGMLISETPSAEHGALPEKPERDEGPHLSYALQWYVFILIAGIGVGYAARREYRTLNAGSDVVREQDRRTAARKKRRGPSDSDEEDALLDS